MTKNTRQECAERNREFLKQFHSALAYMIATRKPDARRRAINFTVKFGHPRYPVTFERAYPIVCSIVKHNHNPCKRRYTRMMWFEIADRVRTLTDDGNGSIAKALEYVLAECRASQFFMDPDYAYRLAYRLQREERQRRVALFTQRKSATRA